MPSVLMQAAKIARASLCSLFVAAGDQAMVWFSFGSEPGLVGLLLSKQTISGKPITDFGYSSWYTCGEN